MITLDSLRAYGADVDDGLRRCVSNEAFYLRLVGSLKDNTQVQQLRDAIAAGDLNTAFEAAHALKGLFGNLALTPLYQPIQEITELLRRREAADYAPLLAEITAQWEKLAALL